jgi:predicted Zn-dependent protease
MKIAMWFLPVLWMSAAPSLASEPQAACSTPEVLAGLRNIIVPLEPNELWRDKRTGAFRGRVLEGGMLEFTYVIRDVPPASGEDERSRPYSDHPDDNYVNGRAVSREQAQSAIADAFNAWAQASGRIAFRRVQSGERANIVVSFAAPKVWRIIQPGRKGGAANGSASMNILHPNPQNPDELFVYLNREFCWHLGDESACPQRREAYRDGQRLMIEHLPGTAIHEIGHVLGFDHPEEPTDSIMYKGGHRVQTLTQVDQCAVRQLYDRLAASLGAGSR